MLLLQLALSSARKGLERYRRMKSKSLPPLVYPEYVQAVLDKAPSDLSEHDRYLWFRENLGGRIPGEAFFSVVEANFSEEVVRLARAESLNGVQGIPVMHEDLQEEMQSRIRQMSWEDKVAYAVRADLLLPSREIDAFWEALSPFERVFIQSIVRRGQGNFQNGNSRHSWNVSSLPSDVTWQRGELLVEGGEGKVHEELREWVPDDRFDTSYLALRDLALLLFAWHHRHQQPYCDIRVFVTYDAGAVVQCPDEAREFLLYVLNLVTTSHNHDASAFNEVRVGAHFVEYHTAWLEALPPFGGTRVDVNLPSKFLDWDELQPFREREFRAVAEEADRGIPAWMKPVKPSRRKKSFADRDKPNHIPPIKKVPPPKGRKKVQRMVAAKMMRNGR